MLEIHQIINKPIASNCFLVYDKDYSNECLIIDPGSEKCNELDIYIESEKLIPKCVILTHEHFDHCWGCNYLQQKYSVPILCSLICSERVRHHNMNYSVFYSPLKAFDVLGKIQVIDTNETLEMIGHTIKVYYTPGHTDSSISIKISNALFTGDTLIKGHKTVTKLPGGSKKKIQETTLFYQSLRGNKLIVYPGHGAVFELDSYDFMQIEHLFKFC